MRESLGVRDVCSLEPVYQNLRLSYERDSTDIYTGLYGNKSQQWQMDRVGGKKGVFEMGRGI